MSQGNEPAVPGTAADARRVVLFDFDGVIVRHQTLELFFRQRLSGLGRWRLLLALPYLPFIPFMLRGVRGSRVLGRVFMRVVTFGRVEEAYRRQADAFAREYARRPGVFIRDGVAALRRHMEAGDRAIIVTGNEQSLVEAVLDEINLRGVELVASQVRGGLFGVHFTRHNVDVTKVASLKRAGVPLPWAVAYGDSLADLPMLKAADARCLVNPSAKLEKKVKKALAQNVDVLHWY